MSCFVAHSWHWSRSERLIRALLDDCYITPPAVAALDPPTYRQDYSSLKVISKGHWTQLSNIHPSLIDIQKLDCNIVGINGAQTFTWPETHEKRGMYVGAFTSKVPTISLVQEVAVASRSIQVLDLLSLAVLPKFPVKAEALTESSHRSPLIAAAPAEATARNADLILIQYFDPPLQCPPSKPVRHAPFSTQLRLLEDIIKSSIIISSPSQSSVLRTSVTPWQIHRISTPTLTSTRSQSTSENTSSSVRTPP